MLKRLILALAGLFVLAQAHASGTIPGFSLTPQFDLTGKVMPGCKLNIIQAGTVSTPQNAYQDTGLTTALPNPMTCDAAGRLPQWFVADGLIKLRLTSSAGNQVFVGDNLLVVGPSGGGGGGGVIDPTTIASTGDTKWSYGSSILSGWVRMNGRTIGSSTSGATERANADAQALFQYLWTTDANLVVSGGRGVSAAADWAANKTITLPDAAGRTIAAIDDIGGGDKSRLSSSSMTSCRTSLGCVGGEGIHTLLLAELPTGITSNGVTGTLNLGATVPAISLGGNVSNGPLTSLTPGTNNAPGIGGGATWGQISTVPSFAFSATSNNTSGGAHNLVQPTILMTPYMKL